MTGLPTLRREIFARRRPLHPGILSRVAGIPRYFFLRNPSGQMVYLYLVDLVQAVSQKWFEKDLASLRILDWGCGPGQVTFLLKELGADVVSADREREADDSAFGQQSPFHAEMSIVPLRDEVQLPFQEGEFDVVTSFGVLEHVQYPQESLREIRRVLRPNGLFFCYNLPYRGS
ncbi:MAG: class I SAM-dependent methyltransferase, partial [Candidatus Eremiobacterota bacterium]